MPGLGGCDDVELAEVRVHVLEGCVEDADSVVFSSGASDGGHGGVGFCGGEDGTALGEGGSAGAGACFNGNVGADRANAGELAVIEDVARHPGSTIRDITERTGLAQSLVSRIVHATVGAGALAVTPDERDRRKVRVELSGSTRDAVLQRANNTLDEALAIHTPHLTDAERATLLHHLAAAAELLRHATLHS